MKEDLDAILAEQYHSARNRLKLVKRLRKVFNYQTDLDRVEQQIHHTMNFFETMICDKRLLKKKLKRRKRSEDILAKNTIRTAMKSAFAVSTLSYRMMLSYWETYMSFWNLR